jgi:hypothetical protein
MNTTTTTKRLINEEVTVTGMYFRASNPDDRHIKGYPKRMEYEGREYTFIESGLRYLLRMGQQLFEVFDMTDGTRDYRLKFDTDAHIWTLVGVRDGGGGGAGGHAVA